MKNFIKLSFPIALLTLLILSSASKPQWKKVWSDEFNYNGLPDSSKWSYDTKGNAGGWGNKEEQYYTENDTSNAIVNNGTLKIIARKQAKEGKQYTSARLVSRGKAEFKYGRIEIRAKIPAGTGITPAIWMMGKNIENTDWPECGEIDIMEHAGFIKDSIFGTVHSAAYNHLIGTQKTKGIFCSTINTAFHIYTLNWTKDKMEILMDGKCYNTIMNEHLTTKEWPFDQPFYFILNLAVGGNWGNAYGIDNSIFPAVMEIDYIRVYSK